MATRTHHEAVSGIKSPTNLQIESDKSTSWKNWLQQFEWYATDIQLENKQGNIQTATFMTVIGPDAIEIYNSFKLSYADKNNIQIVKEGFREYFAPKVNISFERYICFKMKQNEYGTIYLVLTRITTQSSKYEFDTLLDEMLTDKIVFGIISKQVTQKLLTEDKLNLSKAINIYKTVNKPPNNWINSKEKSKADKVSVVKKRSAKKKQNEDFDCKQP